MDKSLLACVAIGVFCADVQASAPLQTLLVLEDSDGEKDFTEALALVMDGVSVVTSSVGNEDFFAAPITSKLAMVGRLAGDHQAQAVVWLQRGVGTQMTVRLLVLGEGDAAVHGIDVTTVVSASDIAWAVRELLQSTFLMPPRRVVEASAEPQPEVRTAAPIRRWHARLGVGTSLGLDTPNHRQPLWSIEVAGVFSPLRYLALQVGVGVGVSYFEPSDQERVEMLQLAAAFGIGSSLPIGSFLFEPSLRVGLGWTQVDVAPVDFRQQSFDLWRPTIEAELVWRWRPSGWHLGLWAGPRVVMALHPDRMRRDSDGSAILLTPRWRFATFLGVSW